MAFCAVSVVVVGVVVVSVVVVGVVVVSVVVVGVVVVSVVVVGVVVVSVVVVGVVVVGHGTKQFWSAQSTMNVSTSCDVKRSNRLHSISPVWVPSAPQDSLHELNSHGPQFTNSPVTGRNGTR